MIEFDKRWKTLAARARAAAVPQIQMPPALAARVVAQWRVSSAPPLSAVWLRFGLRALAGVAALLVLCAVMELRAARGSQGLTAPHVEDTVAQAFWII